MDLPRVLILSTVSVDKAANIAREMGADLLADEDHTRYHVLTIDNKYYSAKVLVCATDIHCAQLETHRVEAVILHHDPKEKDMTSLDDCLPLIGALSKADIFLLASEAFNSPESREKVTEWSHNNKFELVEMKDPESADIMDAESEDRICGIDRLVETLHTHVWPNTITKTRMSGRVPMVHSLVSAVDQVEDQLGSIRLSPETQENSGQFLMESVLDGIMGEENTDFGDIFSRLMDMKEHASAMSSTQRREAAEQLVTAFWKAMGGDPAEVEDLGQ